MTRKNHVRSVIEKVSILEFSENRERLIATNFSPNEIEELLSRPDNTGAGFLAVKRALLALFKSIDNKNPISEKSIRLSHEKSGAPCITSLPSLSAHGEEYSKKDFHISITHNRINAFGLAAFQEKNHD